MNRTPSSERGILEARGASTVRRLPLLPRVEKAFADALLRQQLVTPLALQQAVTHAQREGMALVDAVVSLGFTDEPTSYRQLADALNLTYVEPGNLTPSPLALRLVPARVARRHELLPIAVDDRKITYVTANPFDADAEKDVTFTTGRTPVAALSCLSELRSALNRVYPTAPAIDDAIGTARVRVEPQLDMATTIDEPADSAVINLCNALIGQAVQAGASDVHLDPMDTGLLVRFRVGGVLDAAATVPADIASLVRNRIKVMAQVDISVRHRPQDGAFGVVVSGRRIDVRLSTLPTTHGEKLVIRLIDSQSGFQALERLGYPDELLGRLHQVLERPDGLLLVTGPTGSGKTTALYAALHHLRNGQMNIVSVEDPVERELSGVNQIPVNPRAGTTFASVLRSVLRQDPNVVMVGEIRDAEVASIVGQAAYTGHLVLSSVHTIDAATAVTRLLNLGLEPFRVAETLTGILAQRLVRRLCPHCSLPHGARSQPGRGCQACNHTGFIDRVPVAELLTPDDAVRNLIARGATAVEIRQAMRRAGVPSMHHCAQQLLDRGVTCASEVARVLGASSEAAATSATAGVSVLIADDEPITRTLVRLLLERDGHTVIEADTGLRALELAKERRPAAIVMDLNMPQMSGYDAIAQLRATPGLASVPILVLTAEEGLDVERQVLALGADDYIVKPFETAALTARVNALFTRQRWAA